MISQRFRPAVTIAIIPSVKGGAGNTEFVQGALGRQMRLLDQLDNLCLFGCRISHASSSPSPFRLFLSRRFSRVRSATTSFKAVDARTKILHLAGGRGAGRVARQPALAGIEELLRPAVIHRGSDTLAAAELGDILLAAQSLQHDADFLFRRILPAG